MISSIWVSHTGDEKGVGVRNIHLNKLCQTLPVNPKKHNDYINVDLQPKPDLINSIPPSLRSVDGAI